MKIQELRQMISKADRSLVEKAFAETYKKLKKAQKEEADDLIRSIFSGEENDVKAEKKEISFEELERQILTFLENAQAGYYYAPNRIIPKHQRPKWRFLVKGYIKELEKIQVDSVYYDRAVRLLRDLYKLICTACNYYLFSTEDPFRSIGWDQQELYCLVAAKTFGAGYSKENIAEMVKAACTGGISRVSLYEEQEFALLTQLKTTDVKYLAIEAAKDFVKDREETLPSLKNHDSKLYYLEEEINNLCDLILMLSISLEETERGVKYYFKSSKEVRKEIILYRALQIAELMDEDSVWIEIYKYGLTKKIKPREELVEKYQKKMEKI